MKRTLCISAAAAVLLALSACAATPLSNVDNIPPAAQTQENHSAPAELDGPENAASDIPASKTTLTVTAGGQGFMMRSDHLTFRDVRMKGKYSFQYITDSVFENCVFDTKDAFWHGKNITVRNSVVKGEYLAWYSENITFENCKIIGTQPLCYCKNLKLIDCEMVDTDLAFERSEVEATLTAPIVSIKNPMSGHIYVPEAGEIIMDIADAKGEIVITKECQCA